MCYFKTLHPLTAFFYFASVLLLTVFTSHPVLQLLAFFGGLVFSITVQQEQRPSIFFDFLLFLLIAVSNPLFVHKGATPLFFLNGNAITLQAVFYGFSLAVALLAAVFWFRCLNGILTNEKLLYLFGRVWPKAALLLSMALRFVPLLRAQAKKISSVQKTMGLYTAESWLNRLRGTLRTYSALVTWALENAVDVGIAMKGRGYGLKGRTVFSLFCFKPRDYCLLSVTAVLDAVILAAMAGGSLKVAYYPRFIPAAETVMAKIAMAAFAVLTFLPVILQALEELKWHYCKLKI